MSSDPTSAPEPVPQIAAPVVLKKKPNRRKWVFIGIGIVVAALALLFGIPAVWNAINTVSTDDAYVNGHVTFVAPRVPGQVARVWVDDNNRVHKGDLLVQLDKEPYQVRVDIATSAVAAAQSDLVTAGAQARATEAQARSLRFNLDHAIEDVDNQIAVLRSKAAAMESKKAALVKAQADYDRVVPLVKSGAVAREEFDTRTEALLVAKAQLEESLQEVYEVRVGLGLPLKPETGDDLTQVPDNLDQTFSSVRQAAASLMQAAAQLGVSDSLNTTPKMMIDNFYNRDPDRNIDRIYDKLLKEAPAVKQAEAKLDQAKRNLEQAQLDLRYTDIVAEIDGVVTRRDVNPGNNVIAGQGLMALRSLTDIWVDANFKETQLADLRIGQTVDLDVDMYGSSQRFKGRISGVAMGTGSTLALLPPENATGNYVKVVQRVPVRIDLMDYDPDKVALLTGLSVTPCVHIHEESTGLDAGKVLQPYLAQMPAPATAPSTGPSIGPETRP